MDTNDGKRRFIIRGTTPRWRAPRPGADRHDFSLRPALRLLVGRTIVAVVHAARLGYRNGPRSQVILVLDDGHSFELYTHDCTIIPAGGLDSGGFNGALRTVAEPSVARFYTLHATWKAVKE